jgi:hypothetical protein
MKLMNYLEEGQSDIMKTKVWKNSTAYKYYQIKMDDFENLITYLKINLLECESSLKELEEKKTDFLLSYKGETLLAEIDQKSLGVIKELNLFYHPKEKCLN